jgi:hypothetical protein
MTAMVHEREMNMKPGKSAHLTAIFASLCLAAAGFGGVFTVTNTEDAGPGSLRQAILDANMRVGPDTVAFDLPETGVLYNGIVWFIEPDSDLPVLTDDGTVIDGTTQTLRRGDMNPDGPEVYVMGYQGRQGRPVSVGFTVASSHNVIRGLVVSSFNTAAIVVTGQGATYNRIEGNYIGINFNGVDTTASSNGGGINISGGGHNRVGGLSAGARNVISGNRGPGILIAQSDSNVVAGNFVGLDRTGKTVLGNAGDGVVIANAGGNLVGGSLPGEGNVIAGCGDGAVTFTGGKRTRFNVVQGNYLGTDVDGRRIAGTAADAGVVLGNGASCNLIGGSEPDEGNLISGHAGYGVYLFTEETDSNCVLGNRIGTDASGESALPNAYGGVCVYNGPKANVIGPSNVIRFNPFGVFMQFDATRRNRVTRNSISGNPNGGIVLFNEANGGIVPPSVSRTTSGVRGTAVPNGIVEIFSDSSNQGRVYEGTATADAAGNFDWAGTPAGPYVTATATDRSGNTSEFSDPIAVTGIEGRTPAVSTAFSLAQNYPNPFNPVTFIRFSVAEPCRVRLEVFDPRGRQVATLADGRYGAGGHSVRFDAAGLASGVYLVRMEARGYTASRKVAVLK